MPSSDATNNNGATTNHAAAGGGGTAIDDNAVTADTPLQTATWVKKYVPEAFGLRDAVEQSKYRWCVRESALWGIATSSALALHRIRMQSRAKFIVNVGFSTFFLVYVGNYYFCVKRRDHQERMIELLMKLNSFEHALNMPQTVPIDEKHPFVQEGGTDDAIQPQQYVANLPERKEWQPQLPVQQDASNVFRPASSPGSKND